jgi:hypothetical protein
MKKNLKVLLPIFVIAIFIGAVTTASAYYGIGGNTRPAKWCHSNPGTAQVVDGIIDDFEDYGKGGARMEVPIDVDHEFELVEMVWNVNSTHLAIFVEWKDDNVSTGDMMTICMNIDDTNFDADPITMGLKMKTNSTGSTAQCWKIAVTETKANVAAGQNVTGTVTDLYYNNGGWEMDATNSATLVELVHVESHSTYRYYAVILVALEGTDGEDPDFEYTAVHEFMIAQIQASGDGTGKDHNPGFVMAVEIAGMKGAKPSGGASIPAFSMPILLFVGIATIAIIVRFKKLR